MQSSRPSTSSWCPLDILCIDPEGDASCVGIACSKNRKCKAVVAKATRIKAQKFLDEIAQLPADSEEVRQKLIDLAHYLLCKRFHQNQADEMMEKWWSKIHQSTELSPQNLTPPPSPRVSGRHNTPSIQSNRTRLTSRNTNVQSATTTFSTPSRGPAAVSTPPPSPRPTVGRRNSGPRQNNQQSDDDDDNDNDDDDNESVLSLAQEHHDSVLISSSAPNNVRSSPHETNGIDLTDCFDLEKGSNAIRDFGTEGLDCYAMFLSKY
ncbi:MAG: hypothetical protein M1834_009747 [Cirrosporium novae-zelandiae]|nr:MAG: hypothetical protein M1834_009747 [Cirrosporium novae-zelandiae]